MHKQMCIAVLLLLTACGNPDMKQKPLLIKFKLDEPVETLLSASTVDFDKDCNDNICFYDFDIHLQSSNKATAIIETSQHPLIFDDIVSAVFSIVEDSHMTNAKIILGGVPSNSEHTRAIDYFYKQLENLKTSGWRRYIYPYEARIPGSEARKFKDFDTVLEKPAVTGPWKDPALILSKEEWLSSPMLNDWYFYKDGVYLTFSVQRESTPGSEQERGSYLFTLRFRSETEFYKNFIESEDREHWKTLVPTVLKKMAKERAMVEALLKKSGVLIDESYQEPKITVFR
ncbi:hypothetical protein RYA05_31505 [Pseudomonas syringae pv. actinidiae]|uniref:Ribonucleotide reductase alpha subunit n=1 Tax=Pseudomonas syringae pv. actinidiae TaxID=103796 RepID=A0AAN4TPQ6_PSESF|nr:hypothetical protein [Pseudomonas syringae]AKT33361.1 hypothetical protein IYO_028300 [Pseudomonas syringae pv. actinidiae ICMP 18884]AOE59637.1 hypothetical protein NZ708_28165 [Pseudomonas syringae pv. actinidiae ICMP 18708]AYL78706.1 hypothetical protein CN228_00975 [Pseudomonas syringae pv. actinidiae str. Shaanxi_M228]APQ00590.1 hypothetical protein PsaNZ45_28725 [Pseudomonas syringae pv. actinidiae]APQ06343.1 hypothetical protein PsaNZ47_28135 [Pseudomonas syringae pv. actinidiae]